jgi:hypothetical protein
VQNLVGPSFGTTVFTGVHSGPWEFRFGDYSSTAIDPAIPKSAQVVNEVFGPGGNWRNHIARVAFP